MAYPYSKPETIADGAVHLTGLSLAIPASALLLTQAADTAVTFFAKGVYIFCMLFALTASAVYHLTPIDRLRPLLNRIDHAAIYLKIAGTYTPFVAAIGTGFAYGILGIVWAIAAGGFVAKLWFWPPNAKGSLALYLAMGWLSVFLVWPIWHSLSGLTLALVLIGGVVNSAGTWIFAHPGMPYQNALWHTVVLFASICFFSAISISV